MERRKFIRDASALAGTMMLMPSLLSAKKSRAEFMSVLGPLKPDDLGLILIHEHIMVDFIGAKETGPHRYDADKVVAKALPYLTNLKRSGCKTFIDCTPAYLGRDVRILRTLAQESGLNIFTTTGYYCAANEKFLPAHAYTETAEQLAARWIAEWEKGIEDSKILPGVIKTSVDEGPLPPICKKILKAVSITHLQTGLSISAHTGNGVAAMEELSIIKESGVHPSAFRWVHAQNENDKELHVRAARMGAWLEFDGIDASKPESISLHIECIRNMKENGLLNKTLISQDAGWYWVGEPDGGTFRGYNGIFETFLPALRKEGFSDDEINQLLVTNPRESLRIKVRKI